MINMHSSLKKKKKIDLGHMWFHWKTINCWSLENQQGHFNGCLVLKVFSVSSKNSFFSHLLHDKKMCDWFMSIQIAGGLPKPKSFKASVAT